MQWDLAFEAGDAAINSVAADPNGNFLAVATYENTWAVTFSNDGRTWDVRSPADLGLPDDSSVGDVGATSVGWMLVGSVGSSARAWSSADGETWADVPISGSDPVEGVASVEVSALIVSGHEAIATGIDHPPCDRLPDECPLYGAAWVLSDTGWNRLPADSAPSEFAGERVWSIRDGFVMSRQLEILASADGWSWTPVTIDEQITFLNAVLETRGEVLIAGDTPAEDGISQPWIAIARSDR